MLGIVTDAYMYQIHVFGMPPSKVIGNDPYAPERKLLPDCEQRLLGRVPR